MDDATRDELSQIAAEIRELLLWEQELGSGMVPVQRTGPVEANSAERDAGEQDRPLDNEPSHAPPAPSRGDRDVPPAAAPAEPPQPTAPGPASEDNPLANEPSHAPPAGGAQGQSELFPSPREPQRRPGRARGAPPPSQPRRSSGEPEAPLVRALEQPPRQERERRLKTLEEQAAGCTKCALHQGRTKSVFARGSADAELVFIGEGPGFYEDQQGLPFVGKAGKLLDRMIVAMGYQPDEVYICNVVKCRPPENRTPKPDEAGACLPYLEGQLEALAPKVMVALGRTAAEHLGCIEPGQRGWRGKWYRWRGVPVMATYHPAFLLRNPENKRPVWNDLQQIMAKLGKEPPQKRRG